MKFPIFIAVPHQTPAFIASKDQARESGHDWNRCLKIRSYDDLWEIAHGYVSHQAIKVKLIAKELLEKNHGTNQSS